MKIPFFGKGNSQVPDSGRTFIPKSRRLTKLDLEDIKAIESLMNARANLEKARAISRTIFEIQEDLLPSWEMFLNYAKTLIVGSYTSVEFRVEEKSSIGKYQITFLIQNPPRHSSNMKALYNKGLYTNWIRFSEDPRNMYRNWDLLSPEKQELIKSGFHDIDSRSSFNDELPEFGMDRLSRIMESDDSNLLKRISPEILLGGLLEENITDKE